ncbi:MAG: hypothetical protein GY790_01860 [Bacteroidetes bacterium]|nr:hypothetical protein [Bacteroidota bacterium]
MSRKYYLIYPLLISLFFTSCSREKSIPGMVDAHYLNYEIEYLEEKAGDIPTKMLPGNMDAFYTKHHVYTKIDGFFSQFTLVQIADLKKRQVTTLLDFFGTHVCYTGEPGELPAGIREPDQMKIRNTGDTLSIGGFLSERIAVETSDEQFDIYCTREIRVRHPNISTPYLTVNHPLTAFRIQLSKLKMDLSCSKSEYKAIDSEIFTIPEEYKPVNRETMEGIINNLFTKD